MDFLAVLVCDYRTRGRAGIGCYLCGVVRLTLGLWELSGFYGKLRGKAYHDASIVKTAYDGCSRACGFGQRYASGVEGRIAVVIAEVEAWHCEGCRLLQAASSGRMEGVRILASQRTALKWKHWASNLRQ